MTTSPPSLTKILKPTNMAILFPLRLLLVALIAAATATATTLRPTAAAEVRPTSPHATLAPPPSPQSTAAASQDTRLRSIPDAAAAIALRQRNRMLRAEKMYVASLSKASDDKKKKKKKKKKNGGARLSSGGIWAVMICNVFVFFIANII